MPEIISATLFDTIKEELPNNQVYRLPYSRRTAMVDRGLTIKYFMDYCSRPAFDRQLTLIIAGRAQEGEWHRRVRDPQGRQARRQIQYGSLELSIDFENVAFSKRNCEIYEIIGARIKIDFFAAMDLKSPPGDVYEGDPKGGAKVC